MLLKRLFNVHAGFTRDTGQYFHEGQPVPAPVYYLEFFARDRPARRAQRFVRAGRLFRSKHSADRRLLSRCCTKVFCPRKLARLTAGKARSLTAYDRSHGG